MFRPDIHKEDFTETLRHEGFTDEDIKRMGSVVTHSALLSYQSANDIIEPMLEIQRRIAAEQEEAERQCDEVFGAVVADPNQGQLPIEEVNPWGLRTFGDIG